MKNITLLLLLFVPSLAASAQSTLNVEVVLNKPDAGGNLMLLLCPSEAAYDKDEGCTPKMVKADGRTVRVTFTDVKPGTYAVKVFHDINSDRKLNTSWVGWPQEPYGFSNDAPVNMGPPSFKLAAITVKEGVQTSRINLR
ncbi:MAG: DUF2141 domain-containing protein [Flavobacteriales bacterium]|jgi:uncharacterized protein (DUF2141 family)|nr:DUF2141 domain-containing protein [Flavobacteriales bacterium]